MSSRITKQFGVIVNQINNSQLSHTLLTNLNNILANSSDITPTIFFQQFSGPSLASMCPKMHYVHAWNYPAILMATDLSSAIVLQNCIRATRKLFYIHDLEWLYLKTPVFEHLNSIYNNPDIELIARSQSHFEVIERVWKKPIGIIDNFAYQDLLTII